MLNPDEQILLVAKQSRIKPGGKYGIVVTKKNSSDHKAVDLSLWFQDFSKDSAPRNILNVHDSGQF